MVNVLKHRKISKNPFVKFLKDFLNYDEETIKDIRIASESEGFLSLDLDEERTVVINDSSIYLINSNYSSLGCIEIPIDELRYDQGNLHFIIDSTDSDLKFNMNIFFDSKKVLYEVINEFDSIRNESEFKELLLIFQDIGIRRNRFIYR